jgi:uncharacterized protein (DUF983 family)
MGSDGPKGPILVDGDDGGGGGGGDDDDDDDDDDDEGAFVSLIGVVKFCLQLDNNYEYFTQRPTWVSVYVWIVPRT